MASGRAETKTVLVTGGARGIGRAIAQDMSRDHCVALVYRNTVPEWCGEDILALQGDLTEQSDIETCIAATLDRFGRLDVIVNNAGLVAPSPLDEFDRDAYRRVFDVNALAPHALLAAALPHLKPGAAVVNISSVNATLPPMRASLYGASKAALELWTKGAAKELGPRGIRVNAVSPGAIDIEDAPRTAELNQAFVDMTAMGRMGTPDDIASAVRFLTSEDASFITGEVLVVSGGYRL